ncbi:GTP-binding protein Era [Parasphingorhabdus marina DSM 22363]|uniref:GTPase Era n=1 Tax=Parasphingorhabdus marina DSM 22363 TaxID=1123272 RepID=A0A1N6FMP5_9SPHN|nr:GTPase Era [Parasphingorhabdus marina]SIN96484.1 GTP-binding protein Era [Parasphingorhabdus marina DSM 22363]
MTKKCGVVALIGAPNAGKSTIINALVGQKVAITSSKPQTTRTRLLGIAIAEETQLLLVDTPGIFEPRRRLDRAMVSAAWEGAEDADILVLLVDARAGLGPKVTSIVERMHHRKERKILVLNKVDIAAKDKLLNHASRLNELAEFEETFFVSAKTGDGLPELREYLVEAMPEGPWHFPEDQVSDVSERLLAAEITREQVFRQLHAELPYAIAIAMEQYKDRADGSLEIHQQILVEKPSQKAIVLGKGGHQIKDIGAKARAELSNILGRKVHLYLHVKVSANWDEDKGVYEDMGLDWVK